MRRPLLIITSALLFAAATVQVWWNKTHRKPPPAAMEVATAEHRAAPPATQAARPDARTVRPTAEGLVILPEIATIARQLNEPGGSGAQDLVTLQALLDFYRRTNSQEHLLAGENDEIVAQLCGQNSKHLAVLPPGMAAINAAGQLLDRWGAPYFFHSVSRDQLEIRSAGPDGRLWTDDDLTR